HDIDLVNEGGLYREDGVDIVGIGCDTEGANCTGGFALGYTTTDEWLNYTINVEKEANYMFRANVSSGLDGGSFMLFIDNKPVTDTIKVPAGEDWNTYKFVEGSIGKVTQGKHVLKVLFTGSYVNMDWILFGSTEQEMPIQDRSITSLIPSDKEFRVYNLKGKLMHSMVAKGISEVREQVKESHLQGGVYMIRSTDGLIKQLIRVAK
ncbi:MAG TPA: carbohydrate-binding protein, partial [Fibrobacteraceae bacterium]|nr:carbohydrate-binding protein [Fibrobacteraceae bacterium]